MSLAGPKSQVYILEKPAPVKLTQNYMQDGILAAQTVLSNECPSRS